MWSKGYSSVRAWVVLIFFEKIRGKVKKIEEQLYKIGIDYVRNKRRKRDTEAL